MNEGVSEGTWEHFCECECGISVTLLSVCKVGEYEDECGLRARVFEGLSVSKGCEDYEGGCVSLGV